MSYHPSQGDPTLADLVRAIPGGEHLELCYSCGTCVSKCMIQQKVEPEYNPRRLLRMVMLGMRERAQVFGGQLEIHGKRGEGTTVRVRIPARAVRRSVKACTTS